MRVVARGFGWTHAGRQRPALDGIDLLIAPGERVLLCGDSGSGKSTLLAALAGVLGGDEDGVQSGELFLESDHRREVPGRSIPVGLVLQDPDSQVIAARVGDDVAFGCENLGVSRSQMWARVGRALEMVDLNVALNYPTIRLSGGQKQRLALAGVIAMGAGLIVLDEPTANLDPQGARDVVAAVSQVARETGATLVVVEHRYEQWAHLLERAIVLEHGRLVADAPFATIAASRTVSGLPRARTLKEKELSAPALWSKDLVTRFGPPRTAALPARASTVVTGRNGVGKTTWLLTVAGLLPARGGMIGVADCVRKGLPGQPEKWSSRDLARRIGFVFQNPEHQFVSRSVAEELRVTPRVMAASHVLRKGGIRGGVTPSGLDDAAVNQRIDELVERLRLTHLVDANPFTLSGGEKRRLSVATALVTAPEVLLLDEPTFGQDPHTFAELVRLLRELADTGTTIASVTHDPLFIGALGDYRIEFGGGDNA